MGVYNLCAGFLRPRIPAILFHYVHKLGSVSWTAPPRFASYEALKTSSGASNPAVRDISLVLPAHAIKMASKGCSFLYACAGMREVRTAIIESEYCFLPRYVCEKVGLV